MAMWTGISLRGQGLPGNNLARQDSYVHPHPSMPGVTTPGYRARLTIVIAEPRVCSAAMQ